MGKKLIKPLSSKKTTYQKNTDSEFISNEKKNINNKPKSNKKPNSKPKSKIIAINDKKLEKRLARRQNKNEKLEYKSYLTDMDNLMSTLKEFGVAVIPNIFSEEKCIELRNKIFEDLKYITKNRFDINDEKTWRNFYDLMPLHSMLIQHYSIAHLQPVWDIRQDESIGDVFSKIWKVPKTQLLSSFDGISVHLPPEKTNKGWYLGNDWLHTDQGPLRQHKEIESVQGFVNLFPVNDGDATLSIMEKSYLFHREFFESIKYKGKDDWYKLQPGQKQFFINKGCKQFCVKAPIGSLVLWDSRTMHQGIEPNKDRKTENTRVIVYTCLLPKSRYNEKQRSWRRSTFNSMRVTNHLGTKMFAKLPRSYGNEMKEMNQINAPKLTDYGKSLV